MKCLFFLQEGNTCYCEALSDGPMEKRRLSSSWVCRNSWKTLCPYYNAVMTDREKPARSFMDDVQIPDASCIGHINRIGGYRTILTDLS